MAVAELIVSRREVLAAACAPPGLSAIEGFLSRHPGLACRPSSFPRKRESIRTRDQADQAEKVLDPRLRGDDERWSRALARYRAAEAALAAAARAPEEVYDRLGARHDAALKRLLRVPAPHLAALADKLELAVDQQAWELTGGDGCMAALIADARQLTAPAA